MGKPEWQYKDIHTVLKESAERYPDKVYMESPDQGKSITFARMAAMCNRIANFLKDKGIGPDDRISLIAENSIETLAIFLGVLGYGAIINPINVEESQENMYRLLNRAKSRIVFHGQGLTLDRGKHQADLWVPFSTDGIGAAENDFLSSLEQYSADFEAAPLNKDGLSTIVFTSGTTSTPKGVLSTRESIYFMAAETIDRLKVTEKDVVLDYRAYSWNSPQILSILPTLITGATLVFARRFSRSRFTSWLKDYGVTICIGVPTVINFLLEKEVPLRKDDIPSLRFMTSSSAPLMVQNLRRFEEQYGIQLNQLAGSSETNIIGMNDPETLSQPEKRKIGSIGLAPRYKEVYIMDDDGRKLPSGEEGEIIVKGRSTALGYLLEDDEISKFPDEGIHTGDLGIIDKDCYIFITGRKKDLIIRGGVNISPMEVDTWLIKHPGVQEAATIGVPDKTYGEEVASFIIPKEGYQLNTEEIVEHCKEKLPDFKLPKTVDFVEEFPRNPNGKVVKSGLLKIWEERRKRE